MKKILLGNLLLLICLTLSSCNKEEAVDKIQPPSEVSHIQDKPLYKTTVPYKEGVAKSLFLKNIPNPLDKDLIGVGQWAFLNPHFSPNEVYIQSGQYLDSKILNSFTERKSDKNPNGLNPSISRIKNAKNVTEILNAEKNNPEIFSHIHEQNITDKEGNLLGMSLSIALNEVYYISGNIDDLYYSDEVVLKEKGLINEGKKIGEKLVDQIKKNEEIPDVPILITLYKQENADSQKPGIFLSKAYTNSNKIKWEDLNNKNYTFNYKNTDNVKAYDPQTFSEFITLYEEVQDNFQILNPKIYGVGSYIDNEISDFKVNIHAPFITYPQIIGLVQLVSSFISAQKITPEIPLKVYIYGLNNELVSWILWDPEEKKVYTEII